MRKGVEGSIHGTGLFAAADILSGTELVTKGGIIMCWAQIQLLSPRAQTSWLQVGEDRFLAAPNDEQCDAIMTCVNHTCDRKRVNIGMQGDITGVAMRDILEGEEILYFYPTFFVKPEWRMPCECGFSGCQGELHGNMLLEDSTIERDFDDYLTRYARSLLQRQRAQRN